MCAARQMSIAAAVLGVLAVGCGGAPAQAARPASPQRPQTVEPSPARPEEPPAPPPRLVVLPAESQQYPRLASRLTRLLTRARPAGLDKPTLSRVSLEVVQLSIECVEASRACYRQVGENLETQRLLFARVVDRRRRGPLRVEVMLFDVESGATARAARRTFRNERAAVVGAAALVREVAR